jgi:large subunit ribosomal protein L30
VAKKLRVTLVKSIIGLSPKQEATVHALGLRRIRQTVEHDDTPTIRGMIDKVPFMLAVRDAGVAGGAAAGGEATDQTKSAKRAESSGSRKKAERSEARES